MTEKTKGIKSDQAALESAPNSHETHIAMSCCMMIAFCRSQMLLACGWYATHNIDSTFLILLRYVTIRLVNAGSRSDLSLAILPYLEAISSKNCATVSASLCLVAFNSTSLVKLSIDTIMYLFPFLSSRVNTIISYDTSKNGRDTMKECLHFTFSLKSVS